MGSVSEDASGEPVGFFKDMFNHANDISGKDALQLCADHLQGQWKGITIEDFNLSVIQ